MQINTQQSLPVTRFFEDGRLPPPVQLFFPVRRHNSSAKCSSKSVTPTDRWRQQTLTQITPSLSRISSSFAVFEEDNHPELELADAIMPPKKKQRRSNKLPSQRQTITQMNPFRAQLYPEEDPLNFEEEAVKITHSPPPPPPRRKRKSTSATPITRTVETRSARKRAAEATVEEEVTVSPTKGENNVETTAPSGSQKQQTMPPPQTPKTVRRKIIPSSQSPAETPWSSNKGSKRRLQKATPLRERSVNTPSKVRLCSRRKSVQWAPKLEVADSTEPESVDLQFSSPIIGPSRPAANAVEKPTSPPEFAKESPLTRSIRTQAVDHQICVSPGSNLRYRNLQTNKKQETIADSDEEDPVTQTFDIVGDDEARVVYRMSGSPNQNNNTSVSDSIRLGRQQVQQALHQHESENVNNAAFKTAPAQEVPQPIRTPHQAQTPIKAPGQTDDTKNQTEDDENSAELPKGLFLFSSPTLVQRAPFLETESQFENAWRDYSSPVEENSVGQAVEHGIEPETQAPLSTYRILSSTDLHSLPPVPPSQATTNDTTQASIRYIRNPHQECVHTARARKSKSPPSQQKAISSSSPFQSRKEPAADTYMGYQGWNGVPMTDSQLLPDSLLNDSLGMPFSPGVGEDLELEMEG
ncbi:MAG: hypothetical protein Q9182_005428 [Xanthomendoza sp. 2 TL-2023]